MQGYAADVLVRDGEIVYTGQTDLNRTNATTVIDAAGKVVTPGFIDLHAHGDPLQTPDFENFLAMGVTTIVLGQDGTSPDTDYLGDWMKRVDDARPGTNIVMFIGHNTVRSQASVPLRTSISERDIERMQDRIIAAMEDGAFGLSTGLEYDPGRFAGRDELRAIAEPLARYGGIVMSHLRNEDSGAVEDALLELITMGRDAGVPVHVSHIKIVLGNNPTAANNLIQLMDMARNDGMTITADVYPYTASYTGISLLFPDWAKPPNVYEDVVRDRRRDLAAFLENRVNNRNGPGATLIGTGKWAGKTLAEVADELGKPFEDVLIDDIGLYGTSAAYFVMNEDVMRRFIRDPHISISSDGSPSMLHPRGYGSFAKIIRQYVMQENLITLEEAIRKMTGHSAGILGLHDKPAGMKRGYIRDGYAADILVFDPAEVRDNAWFQNPHRLATGFDTIIVNGTVVQSEGRPSGARAGRVLRKSGSTATSQ
ncbi:MAG: N-acyl-D-amino acid deacylase [Balneolaceae bacterium]|nr:MAG: N-acyl-D-amino acid deacylase [Balneolaceae bacterium]